MTEPMLIVFGVFAGAIALLPERPVKFTIAAGPTFGPDAGPDWRFRFQANFLFPR